MYLSQLWLLLFARYMRLQLSRLSFSIITTPLLFPACQARQYFLRGGAFKGGLIGCIIFILFPQFTQLHLHVVLSIMVNLSSKWDRFCWTIASTASPLAVSSLHPGQSRSNRWLRACWSWHSASFDTNDTCCQCPWVFPSAQWIEARTSFFGSLTSFLWRCDFLSAPVFQFHPWSRNLQVMDFSYHWERLLLLKLFQHLARGIRGLSSTGCHQLFCKSAKIVFLAPLSHQYLEM